MILFQFIIFHLQKSKFLDYLTAFLKKKGFAVMAFLILMYVRTLPNAESETEAP